jgi:hypothetical protein
MAAREIQIRNEVLGSSLMDDDALLLGGGPGENGGTLPMTPAEAVSNAL